MLLDKVFYLVVGLFGTHLAQQATPNNTDPCQTKQRRRTCNFKTSGPRYTIADNFLCDTKDDQGGWIIFQANYELRIDMTYKVKEYFAKYTTFKVGSEENKYKLTIGGFTGNVVDSFKNHSGLNFSTPDSDNDASIYRHCARHIQSGWWFGNCLTANLNGQFGNNQFGCGVIWESLTGDFLSLTSVEMKLREIKTVSPL